MEDAFTLRREKSPWIFYVVLDILALIFTTVVLIRTPYWYQIFEVNPILWLASAPMIYFNLRYSITFVADEIKMTTSGKNVVMKLSEITQVKKEFSFQSGRPPRRIAIYAVQNGKTVYIDVSFKHFNLSDIHKLVAIIHAKRPDLEMPTFETKNKIFRE